MAEYSSNSHKMRDSDGTEQIPEKKVGPVISGTATTQKKNGFSKFANSIIAEDVHSVGSYILSDVLIPSFKKAIQDIVTNGIDMLLYGKVSGNRSGSNISRISYGSYYSGSRLSEPSNKPERSSVFDYDNIVFGNRGDAEAVLSAMDDIMDRYGFVSVGDFYDLADVPNNNYTVEKYGWKDIRSTQVIRARDGYIIKLPRAIPIN